MIELIKHEISLPEFIGKTTTSDNCGLGRDWDLPVVTNIPGPAAIFHQNDHSQSQHIILQTFSKICPFTETHKRPI